MSHEFNELTPTPEPVVGDVYALRCYRYVPAYGVLRGLAHPQITLDGVNVAVCRTWANPLHTAPMEGCTCGFYAYDEYGATPERHFSGPITTVVRVSGKIIPCERGLKAEKVQVVALAWPGAKPDRMARLQENYPSVAMFDSIPKMLAEFPLTRLPRGEDATESDDVDGVDFDGGEGGDWDDSWADAITTTPTDPYAPPTITDTGRRSFRAYRLAAPLLALATMLFALTSFGSRIISNIVQKVVMLFVVANAAIVNKIIGPGVTAIPGDTTTSTPTLTYEHYQPSLSGLVEAVWHVIWGGRVFIFALLLLVAVKLLTRWNPVLVKPGEETPDLMVRVLATTYVAPVVEPGGVVPRRLARHVVTRG